MSNQNPCDGCIHSTEVKSDKLIGQVQRICTRFPPTPIAVPVQSSNGMQVQIIPVFPPVIARCGEYDDGVEDAIGDY